MKADLEIQELVILTMTMEEALWLKAVVQNPLYDDEHSADANARKALFEALNEAGVKEGRHHEKTS